MRKISYNNTKKNIKAQQDVESEMLRFLHENTNAVQEDIREKINEAVIRNANLCKTTVYDICYTTSPKVVPNINIDAASFDSYCYTIELEPIEFEFEKGGGYWKDKYYRLKKKLQELVDNKND